MRGAVLAPGRPPSAGRPGAGRSGLLISLAAALAAVSCGGSAPRSADPSAARRPPPPRGPVVPGPVIAEYTIHYDAPTREITAEARTTAGSGASFSVDRGAERFVTAPEAAAEGEGAFAPMTRRGDAFVAPACAKGPCKIRYRVALGEAARALDDLDVASDEGDAIEAPPSTWLLAPTETSAASRLRFRVTSSEGARFATGVFRAEGAADAWDITIDDLWTSPYTVFGPLRLQTIAMGGASIEIAITPGKLMISDERIARWVSDAARAVSGYVGRFPMRSALVVLVPSSGRWVGGGRTLAGGGGTVFMRVGERAPESAYVEDWVIVHEMTHLVLPSLPRWQSWAEEGLATYVEPFARVRAGLLSQEEAWRGLLQGLPNGLPGPGDRGLDRTPTWGRVYWGGALFWLLADVEIRKRTHGAKGLEHALAALLDAGMNNAQRRSFDEVALVADRATGTTVLRELHDAMGTSPHPVDLRDLERSLGAEIVKGAVRFDDAAPLASVRKAITTGKSE